MLTRFIKWIVSLFVHEATEQIKSEIKQPSTLQDANTSQNLKSRWNKFVVDKLRKPRSGGE